MPITVKLRYLRIAPRKVRLVANLIRGKKVEEAQNILNFTNKKAVEPILKLLKQAINSAKNNFQLEEKNLYVSEILIDEGPRLKRVFPQSRGQAAEIQKKTSHITIVLDEIEKREKKAGPKAAKKKKVKADKFPKERAKFKPEAEKLKPKLEKRPIKMFRRQSF